MPPIRHSCPARFLTCEQPGEDVNDHAPFMARTTGTAGGRPGGSDPLMAAHAHPSAPRAAAAAGNPARGAAWPARAGVVPPVADAFTARADSVRRMITPPCLLIGSR